MSGEPESTSMSCDPVRKKCRLPSGRVRFKTVETRIWTRPDPYTSRSGISWHGVWKRLRKKTEHVYFNAELDRLSQDDEPVESLLDFAAQRLDQLNVVNITTCLHRLAKCWNNEWIADDSRFQALLKIVEGIDFLHHVSSRDLSNLAWSMVRLDFCSDTARIMRLIGDEMLNRDLCSFSAPALAIVLWSFARADPLIFSFDSESLANQLIEESLKRGICQLKDEEFVSVCWSCATLEFCIDREIVTALGTEVLRRDLKRFKGTEICIFCWCFAKLTKTDGRDKGSAVDICMKVLLCLASDISNRCLSEFASKHIILMVWAYGKFAIADVDELMHSFQIELTRRGLSDFSPLDFSMSASSFVRYATFKSTRLSDYAEVCKTPIDQQFSPEMFMKRVLASLLVCDTWEYFESRFLSNLAWTFAKLPPLGIVLRGANAIFQRLAEEMSIRKLKDFGARDLGYVAWAFSKVASGDWATRLANQVLEEITRRGPDAFSQDDIFFLIPAFPNLPWPRDVLNAFHGQATPSPEESEYFPYWSAAAAAWEQYDMFSTACMDNHQLGSAWSFPEWPSRRAPDNWIGRKPRGRPEAVQSQYPFGSSQDWHAVGEAVPDGSEYDLFLVGSEPQINAPQRSSLIPPPPSPPKKQRK